MKELRKYNIERDKEWNTGDEKVSLAFRGNELADVIICADLIAMDEGIDLAQAVKDKFNKTSRKYNLNTTYK